MKPTMTALNLWKVWLTYGEALAQQPKWWVHVLAPSAAVATTMAEEWTTASWNDGSQAIAVNMMLLADSVVWDADVVAQVLAAHAVLHAAREQLELVNTGLKDAPALNALGEGHAEIP